MRLSPLVKASFHRFKAQTRARRSLIVLALLFLLSLPAEFLCNTKPLIMRYQGRWYVPVLRDYTEQDFGGNRRVRPDYLDPHFWHLLGCPEKLPATVPGTEEIAPQDSYTHDILQMFDPEPGDSPPPLPPENPAAILHMFDPEPGDLTPEELAELTRPQPGIDDETTPGNARATTPCLVLWPPVHYDYAYISRRSNSGREVLAAPWPQTIPGTQEQLKSSWIDGHYLGTDNRGRDVLARLVYGFRVSLLFGLLLALSGTFIGAFLGALQGFFGGLVDLFGQRVTEVWGALPQLYLLMILSSLVARNIIVLFVILNLTSWMGMSAYMRAEFLRGRNLDYVRAARALGVGNAAVMWRHLLPNSLTPIITFFPFAVSGGILALVSLDFLQLGVPSPFPSLGELLAQGQSNLSATWIIFPTFIMLSGTITLLTFVGDGLRNAFDPRRRARVKKG